MLRRAGPGMSVSGEVIHTATALVTHGFHVVLGLVPPANRSSRPRLTSTFTVPQSAAGASVGTTRNVSCFSAVIGSLTLVELSSVSCVQAAMILGCRIAAPQGGVT